MVADEITLQKVSISRIKQEMRDVYYLSDDLVIASFDIHRDTLGNYPALIDGFSAIIMASGSAVVRSIRKSTKSCPTRSSSSAPTA